MTRKTGLTEGKKRCCWIEGQEKRKEAAHFTHMAAASQPANNSCHSAILLSPWRRYVPAAAMRKKKFSYFTSCIYWFFLPLSLNKWLKSGITSIHWIWSLSMLSILTVISAYPSHHLPPAKCARELQNCNDTFKYNVFKISLPSHLYLFTGKCWTIRIPGFSRKDVWVYSNSLQHVRR